MDSILLQSIRVSTHIGVPDAERTRAQILSVDIELFHPAKPVAVSDDVSKGIDYDTVTQTVLALAATERKTVERFAEDIAVELLRTFSPAGGVKVSVTKTPNLPLKDIRITIVRP